MLIVFLIAAAVPQLDMPWPDGFALPGGTMDEPQLTALNTRPIITTSGEAWRMSAPTLWHLESEMQIEFEMEELNDEYFVRVTPRESFEPGQTYMIHYGEFAHDVEYPEKELDQFVFRVSSEADDVAPDAPVISDVRWKTSYNETWDIHHQFYEVDYEVGADVRYLQLEFSHTPDFENVLSFYSLRYSSFGDRGAYLGTVLEEREYLRMTAFDLAGNASEPTVFEIQGHESTEDDDSTDHGEENTESDSGGAGGCASTPASFWWMGVMALWLKVRRNAALT